MHEVVAIALADTFLIAAADGGEARLSSGRVEAQFRQQRRDGRRYGGPGERRDSLLAAGGRRQRREKYGQ